MDTLNQLLGDAAGYFGEQQKQDAQIELAKLGFNPVTGQATTPTTTPSTSTAAAAPAAQWIPGVSNGVVIAGGAALVLGIVLVVALRK